MGTPLATRRDSLKYQKFGNSDMVVSEVCAGTMTWGSFVDDEAESHRQLDKCWEMGVNFYDTAELYPVAWNYGKLTEKWIGHWLVKRLADGTIPSRDKIYIATKINQGGTGGIGRPHAYESDIMEKCCRDSLERLQCSYIDLYQLHWPTRDTPIFTSNHFHPDGKFRFGKFFDKGEPEAFEKQVLAVKNLLDKGLIKYWGLSNENCYGITMFCMACDKLGVPRPVSCQNDFSLVNRQYESDTWEAAYRFGVVGLPYGALAGGQLTGKYVSEKWAKNDVGRPVKDSRLVVKSDFQPRYNFPGARASAEKYVKIAEKAGITPAELALAWSKQRPCNANGAIITGTTTVRQVEECVNAFKVDLSDEVMDMCDVVHEEFRSPILFSNSREAVVEAPWLASRV